jgi:hypothetical protein
VFASSAQAARFAKEKLGLKAREYTIHSISVVPGHYYFSRSPGEYEVVDQATDEPVSGTEAVQQDGDKYDQYDQYGLDHPWSEPPSSLRVEALEKHLTATREALQTLKQEMAKQIAAHTELTDRIRSLEAKSSADLKTSLWLLRAVKHLEDQAQLFSVTQQAHGVFITEAPEPRIIPREETK